MKSYKILIIDDDRSDGVLLRESILAITEFSSQTQIAYSLSEAAERIKETRPDVILLDYNLETEKGTELFNSEVFKKLKIPVVLVTSSASKDMIKDALEKGIKSILDKNNLTVNNLKNRIQMAIQNKAA